MKWQDQRFLVVFKSRGRRVTPRLHAFVSDVDQQWSKVMRKSKKLREVVKILLAHVGGV